MNSYIFITAEGGTTDVKGEEIENCQVVAIGEGEEMEEALAREVRKNPDLADAFKSVTGYRFTKPCGREFDLERFAMKKFHVGWTEKNVGVMLARNRERVEELFKTGMDNVTMTDGTVEIDFIEEMEE